MRIEAEVMAVAVLSCLMKLLIYSSIDGFAALSSSLSSLSTPSRRSFFIFSEHFLLTICWYCCVSCTAFYMMGLIF